jgi:hypothetical protein
VPPPARGSTQRSRIGGNEQFNFPALTHVIKGGTTSLADVHCNVVLFSVRTGRQNLTNSFVIVLLA